MWVIFLALIFLAVLAAMPVIVTWQAKNTLAPYGALDQLDVVVRTALEDMKMERIVGAIQAALLLLAGVLIAYKRKTGYYLLIGLGSIAIGSSVIAIVTADAMWRSAVTCILMWGFALKFAINKNKSDGPSWWRSNENRLPARPD